MAQVWQKNERRGDFFRAALVAVSMAVVPLSISAVGQAAAQLPEGEGKQLIEKACVRCHGLGVITKLRRTKEEWKASIADMAAPLSDEEAEIAAGYLETHFGPDSSSSPESEASSPEGAPSKELASTKASAPADVVIRGGRILDMISDEPDIREIKGLVVRNGRIETIIAAGSSEPLPEAAQVIDGNGLYILPGLVDCHIHFRPWFPEPFLHYGVTTFMDTAPCPHCAKAMGVDPNEFIVGWKRTLADPKAMGPVLYITGNKLAGPKAEPEDNVYILQSLDEIPERIGFLAGLGVDGIKAESSLPPDFRKRVVEEAEKRGLPVVGHSKETRESIAAGMKFIEHMDPIVQSLAPEGSKAAEYLMDLSKAPELITLMIDNKVYLNPTLLGRYGHLSKRARAWADEDTTLLKDKMFDGIPQDLRAKIPGYFLRAEKMSAEERKQAQEGFDKVQQFVRDFSARGGLLLTATDSTETRAPGLSMHRELQLTVDTGVPPYKALLGATRLASVQMRKSISIGTLEAGKQADILILGSNPVDDISATEDIRYVIGRGAIRRAPR